MNNIEARLAPGPAGTVLMFRRRGHSVTVREVRNNGGFRYTLDSERERTAFELAQRYAKMYERPRVKICVVCGRTEQQAKAIDHACCRDAGK